jgi:DNA-binding response OmpR family regulator
LRPLQVLRRFEHEVHVHRVDSIVDLVVLDLRLGGEEGLSLARRLHEDFSIPVVIVSGRTDACASAARAQSALRGG